LPQVIDRLQLCALTEHLHTLNLALGCPSSDLHLGNEGRLKKEKIEKTTQAVKTTPHID
jgi:hypothetical protein